MTKKNQPISYCELCGSQGQHLLDGVCARCQVDTQSDAVMVDEHEIVKETDIPCFLLPQAV